jgi:hypothetical protein
MISLFLSKNKTRLTTLDELIDVVVTNKDLLQKDGITNINGIVFYHCTNSDDEILLSYGSNCLKITKHHYRDIKRYHVCSHEMTSDTERLEFEITKEGVNFGDKAGSAVLLPHEAFECEINFFQYTLMNLKYSCTEQSIIKLVNLIQEVLDVKLG